MRAIFAALCIATAVHAAPQPAARQGGILRIEHRDPFALPSRGPANALVTIELFFTPGSQSSRHQVYRSLERLQANHPSRIRLVYRIIDSGGQKRLPRAALYAYAEGKFFEFMAAVNDERGTPDDKALAAIAKRIGLDWDRMYVAMTKPPAAYEDVLAANELRRKQRFRTNPTAPNVLFNGRITQTQTTSLGTENLEREYQAAKLAAEELLDHGVARSELGAAFEQIPPPVNRDIIVQRSQSIDDEFDEPPTDDVLANPPLDLDGWPSYGPANAETTIVVLCSPTSPNCRQPMSSARITRDKYPSSIRVVWAPLFNVAAEEAADLSLLADAALCAETVGTSLEGRDDSAFDDDASPGWRWVEAVLSEANSRRRDLEPEKLIDKVATKLHVDRPAFATCRARVAGTSVKWIEAARRAGARMTPNTVVGGRIYGPIVDASTLQSLVEAELAPGLLAPSWMQAEEK